MANKDDYLIEYRQFFEEFANTVEPNDQLPVKLGSYKFINSEVVGGIVDWCLQYLNRKSCPSTLVGPLIKCTIDEIRQACKKHPVACGFNPNENVYEPLKLMQTVMSKMNEICLRYLDNSQLDNLPAPPTMPPPLVSTCASRNTRRRMEDKHVVIHDINSLFNIQDSSPSSYYAIFDGHAGQDAASYSAAHLHQFLVESAYYPTDPERALKEAFLRTDEFFLEKSKIENFRSGTTAVCALLRPKEEMLYVAWVGDSQALLVNRGKVLQIVKPHKPGREDERDRIEANGGCVMFWGMWRVNGQLAVSRAIGDIKLKPYVTAEPDVAVVPLDGNEEFLIMACDGLWDFVSEDDAAITVYNRIKENSDNVEGIAEHLVELAKQEGSRDNISVIVIFLKDPSKIAKKLSADWGWTARSAANMDTRVDNSNNATNNAFDLFDVFQKRGPLLECAGDYKQNGTKDDKSPSDAERFFMDRQSNGKRTADEFHKDDDDFGPETNVDTIDDVLLSPTLASAKAIAEGNGNNNPSDEVDKMDTLDVDFELQRQQSSEFEPKREAREETPTPPADSVLDNSGVADNVVESEDSEDEWNYYRVDPKQKENIPPVETIEQVSSEQPSDIESEEMSQLNPDAKEFIPVSPTRNTVSPTYNRDVMDDLLIAQSPRRAVPMDISVPSPVEFQYEVKQRPSEVFEELNKGHDNQNGHSLSSQEIMQNLLNGKDVSEIEFHPSNYGKSSEDNYQFENSLISEGQTKLAANNDLSSETGVSQGDISPVEPSTDSQLSPVKDDIDFSKCDFVPKPQDPMSMSFYQDKDEDGFSTNPFDLNKVQMLPESVDELQEQNEFKTEVETIESAVSPAFSNKENIEAFEDNDICELPKTPIQDDLCILAKSPGQDEVCDLAKSPMQDEISDLTKSPMPDELCELAKSPMQDEVCDLAKSPILDEICDLTKSPVQDEVCNLAKSPMQDEVSDLAKSPVQDEVCDLAKSQVQDEVCDLAKSPLQDEVCDLAKSPVQDVVCNLALSPMQDEICDLAKSPVLDETSDLSKSSEHDMVEMVRSPIHDEVCETAMSPELCNLPKSSETPEVCDVAQSPEVCELKKSPTHEELTDSAHSPIHEEIAVPQEVCGLAKSPEISDAKSPMPDTASDLAASPMPDDLAKSPMPVEDIVDDVCEIPKSPMQNYVCEISKSPWQNDVCELPKSPMQSDICEMPKSPVDVCKISKSPLPNEAGDSVTSPIHIDTKSPMPDEICEAPKSPLDVDICEYTKSPVHIDVDDIGKSTLVDIHSHSPMELSSPVGPLSPKSPIPELTGLVSPDITASIKDDNIEINEPAAKSPAMNQQTSSATPVDDVLKSPIQELEHDIHQTQSPLLTTAKSPLAAAVDIECAAKSPVSPLDEPLETQQVLKVESGLSEPSISPVELPEESKDEVAQFTSESVQEITNKLLENVSDFVEKSSNVGDEIVCELSKAESEVQELISDAIADIISSNTEEISSVIETVDETKSPVFEEIHKETEAVIEKPVEEQISQIQETVADAMNEICQMQKETTEVLEKEVESISDIINEVSAQLTEEKPDLDRELREQLSTEIIDTANEIEKAIEDMPTDFDETPPSEIVPEKLNVSHVESEITPSEMNSFLERSEVPDITSPLSPSEKMEQVAQEPQQLADLEIYQAPLRTCVYPLRTLNQEPVEIKCEIIEPEFPVPTIASPCDETKGIDTPPPTPAVVADEPELKRGSPEPQKIVEAVEKLQEAPVVSEAVETESKAADAVLAAAAASVAAAGVAAAVSKTTAASKTATSKAPAKAKPGATTAAKKPATTNRSTPTSPTKPLPSKTGTTAAEKRSTTSTTAARLSAGKAATPRTKTTTAASPASKTAPLAKTTPKPKTPATTPTSKTAAADKKPLTNGDVKAPVRQSLLKKTTTTTTTAKSPATTAAKLSPSKTATATTKPATTKAASTTPKSASAPAKTTTAARLSASTTAKPRPSTLTSRTSTTTSSTTATKTTATRTNTLGVTKSTTATAPKPKPATTAATAPKPRTALSSARPAAKAPDTEKQIKETANKQLSASRTTAARTTTASRTSTATKKLDAKAPISARTTTTRTTTTTLKSSTTGKKPTEVSRTTTVTKTTKTAPIKAPVKQNGVVDVIQQITTVSVVSNDEPQLIKDNSPLEPTAPIIDNSQLPLIAD